MLLILLFCFEQAFSNIKLRFLSLPVPGVECANWFMYFLGLLHQTAGQDLQLSSSSYIKIIGNWVRVHFLDLFTSESRKIKFIFTRPIKKINFSILYK